MNSESPGSQCKLTDNSGHGSLETESRSCSRPSCVSPPEDSPVNGNWGAWNAWTECSKSIGEGHRGHTRSCNNPPPQHGGELCLSQNAGPQSTEFVVETCSVSGVGVSPMRRTRISLARLDENRAAITDNNGGVVYRPWSAWSACSADDAQPRVEQEQCDELPNE